MLDAVCETLLGDQPTSLTEYAADITAISDWVREYARVHLPDVEVVPHRLGQGPPVDAPIEIRIYGEDFDVLRTATEQVLDFVRASDGTADVRETLGTGTPTLVYEIDDAAASRYGLTRSDVADSLLGRTLGVEIGQYRAGLDPVPIYIRSPEGERFSTDHLDTAYVFTPEGESVPLAQLVNQSLRWQPSAIQHRDLRRVSIVLSELEEGYAFGNVTSDKATSPCARKIRATPRAMSLAASDWRPSAGGVAAGPSGLLGWNVMEAPQIR